MEKDSWVEPSLFAGRRFRRRLLLGWRLFLSPKAGFDRGANGSEHLFRRVLFRSATVQFQILVEGLRSSRRRNCLVALQGCFPDKINAFLIIGICFGGIGRNAFIEGCNGSIAFAGVCENRSHVVVVLRGCTGIVFRRLLVSFYGVIDFACLAVGLG